MWGSGAPTIAHLPASLWPLETDDLWPLLFFKTSFCRTICIWSCLYCSRYAANIYLNLWLVTTRAAFVLQNSELASLSCTAFRSSDQLARQALLPPLEFRLRGHHLDSEARTNFGVIHRIVIRVFVQLCLTRSRLSHLFSRDQTFCVLLVEGRLFDLRGLLTIRLTDGSSTRHE